MNASPARKQAAGVDPSREISASRVFEAPRALVWKMFSDPQHIMNWWGPNGFTTTLHKMDFRPGGEWRFIMHGPDGTDYTNKSVYTDIVEPELIAFSHTSGPLFDAIIKLDEEGPRKTRVTWRMIFETATLREKVAKQFGAEEGLKQNIVKLADYIDKVNPSRETFFITRTVNAPRELVWKAWTEEDRLQQWFGPKGVTTFHAKNDFRPGGTYHYGMRTTDGQTMWGKWIYREIVKPERLVFVDGFSDENGGLTRHPMAPTWPSELLTTVTFTEVGKRTTITVTWLPVNATAEEKKTFDSGRDSMQAGWTGTFDRLDSYIAGTRDEAREVNITRFVNARRPLVFDVWTDAKHLAKWWGPRGFSTAAVESDPRTGGALRIDMRGPDGTIYPSKGVFKEVVKPERIVFSIQALDDKGKVVLETLNTVTFREQGDTTVVTVNARVTHAEPEAAPYVAGMKQGWNETVDRFEEYVTA